MDHSLPIITSPRSLGDWCYNPNIGFATKCEVQGPMKSRVCVSVKHILTNGGECKGWSPMIPKCTLVLGVALVWELQMFKALVKKAKKTRLGLHDTIIKVLKHWCLKCHRIVHLDLIFTSYDQKKGQ